jgi:hypothetical protein
MTYDTGFAPNPYYGVLTLATCKPDIRRSAKVGDWIVGWTARRVYNKTGGKPIQFTGNRKLIYMAQICKIMDLGSYWEDKDYVNKRPKKIRQKGNSVKSCCGCSATESDKYDSGDNIYKKIDGELVQQENGHHKKEDANHDIRGKNVLICKTFYYFGVNNAVEVPEKVFKYVNKLPRNFKNVSMEEGQALINYIKQKYPQGGIIGG